GGGAADVPLLVPDRRGRQRDVDRLAVLADADGLVTFDRLAVSQAPEELRHLVAPVGRREEGDRPADRLRRGVAVHPLGAAVPARDRGVARLAEGLRLRRRDTGGPRT